jgi:hypothetical protein
LPRRLGVEVGSSQFAGHAETNDERDIFGSGPKPTFVPSAHENRTDRSPAPYKKCPDPFGGVQLVASDGKEVNSKIIDTSLDFAYGLGGIGVDERSSCMGKVGEPCDRHERPGFILGEHDSHEGSVSPHEGPRFLDEHATLAVDGKTSHFDSLTFKQLARPSGGGMLYRRGDDVSPRRRTIERTPDGEVVGLGAPRREHDFVGLAAEERGHLFAGVFHGAFGALTIDMSARRVAEVLPQVRQHRLDDQGL